MRECPINVNQHAVNSVFSISLCLCLFWDSIYWLRAHRLQWDKSDFFPPGCLNDERGTPSLWNARSVQLSFGIHFFLRPSQNLATRVVSVNKMRWFVLVPRPQFNSFRSIAIFRRVHTIQPYEWCAADTNGLCQFIFASNKWKSNDCIDTSYLRKRSTIADKWCASIQWSAVMHVLHTECIYDVFSRGKRIEESECEWIIMINYNVKPINCSAIMKWKRYSTIPHAANTQTYAST